MAFNDFGRLQEGAPDLARRFNSDHRRGRIVRTAVDDADHTVGIGEYLIAYTALTAARTVNLPAASGFRAGQGFAVKDESGGAGSNNITIEPNGSETIDGAANLVMSTNFQYEEFYTDGSNWFSR